MNQQIISLLKNLSLFNGLDEVELERVASFLHPITLRDGETLNLRGKENPLYIIVMGKVRSTRLKKRGEGVGIPL